MIKAKCVLSMQSERIMTMQAGPRSTYQREQKLRNSEEQRGKEIPIPLCIGNLFNVGINTKIRIGGS